MKSNIFFGLVRTKNVDPQESMYSFGNESEYELYLINDTDSPITVIKTTFGGFRTFEDMSVMLKPQYKSLDIVIEPHGYGLCDVLYESSFCGGGQYHAYIEIKGSVKIIIFYTSRGVGFMGSLIPVLNKYGRVIKPEMMYCEWLNNLNEQIEYYSMTTEDNLIRVASSDIYCQIRAALDVLAETNPDKALEIAKEQLKDPKWHVLRDELTEFIMKYDEEYIIKFLDENPEIRAL